MVLDCDNLVSVDDQILHLTNLIHNNQKYFQEKRFLILGETRLLRLYEKWRDEDNGYITTVDRLGNTRGSALDVMTKLEFIVDELFLATVLGFFERDKRLEESRLDVRAKILILKGFGKIDDDLANALSLLFTTRNGLAHAWSINHVEYAGKRLLDNFHNFRRDLNGAWLKMIQIYRQGQEPVIDAFIQRIENEISDLSVMPMTNDRVCIKEFLLKKIKEAVDKGDDAEKERLIRGAMIPERLNDKTIRLAGYDLDVTGTIHSGSNADEVLGGWNLLVGESVPVDIYLEAFYISTVDTNLGYGVRHKTEVDNETYISNIAAPLVLELLSLSYWIYKCKRAFDQTSFAAKFAEVKEHLTYRDIEEDKENLYRMFRDLGRIMQDESASQQERELAERELMQEVEFGGQFRSNVSSYVPEFMSAYLMKEAGFEVDFIPTTNDKQCDLLVNSFKIEVKTFLDRTHPKIKIEDSLKKEIEETLKRVKAVDDIKDALSKEADIILIFLSFTSLGLAFPKYTYKRNVNFSLQKALGESLPLAEYNRTSMYVEKVPVITFTTVIDAIDITNCVYKTFFYSVPYPVKKDNDKLEPDSKNLKIDLNI